MRTRALGSTDITVSDLTFGCGAVGGLMVRGEAREQSEAVARALDAGVRYFDTAAGYGDGASEETLGRVLPPGEGRAAVGTKVRLPAGAAAQGGAAAIVRRSMEESLRRLRRDRVDLFQLHNPIDDAGGDGALTVAQALEVLPAFQDLKREGKARHIGFTALGDAASIERLVAAGGFEVAQVPFNLLDASAAGGSAGGSARLLQPSGRAGIGTIGIRILAGGALAGEPSRHPVAAPTVAPVGRGRGLASDYEADLAAAGQFRRLVEEGAAQNLAALAIRYALSTEGLDTFAVGFSSLAHLQQALDAVAAGPLGADVLAEIRRIRSA